MIEARLKQQEQYDKYCLEHNEKMKQKLEAEREEAINKHNQGKSSSLRANAEYMPLGGSGGSGFSYRPEKKKPCKPCGGGGCG